MRCLYQNILVSFLEFSIWTGHYQKLFVISSLSIPAQFFLAFYFATVNQHYDNMVSSRADKIATISIREVSR